MLAFLKKINHFFAPQKLEAPSQLVAEESVSEEVFNKYAYIISSRIQYFNDLSFGEYIRKLRIEKAIEYLNSSNYSLTKIAYLTGFSDQSHFTRIFKKHIGQNPSVYRKKLQKK